MARNGAYNMQGRLQALKTYAQAILDAETFEDASDYVNWSSGLLDKYSDHVTVKLTEGQRIALILALDSVESSTDEQKAFKLRLREKLAKAKSE